MRMPRPLLPKRVRDRSIARGVAAYRTGLAYSNPRYDSRAVSERLGSWVFICAERNATAVSQQTLRLYRRVRGGEKRGKFGAVPVPTIRKSYLKSLYPEKFSGDVEEVHDHPFLQLLKHVNSLMTRPQLWKLTTMGQQLVGDAYWHVTFNQLGMPMELWPLPPQQVFPILGENNIFDFYEWRPGAGNVQRFPADEIVHFRMPSPLEIKGSLSNLQGILNAAETNQRMMEWENATFQNYAVPDQVIIPKGDTSPQQLSQMETDWNNQFAGWRNRGKTVISPVEIDVKNLSLSARDLQFKDGKVWTREEIAAGFGVPINIVTVEGITFNNMHQGYAVWMRETIKPILCDVADVINYRLMPMYGEQYDDDGENIFPDVDLFVAWDNPVPMDEEATATRNVAYVGAGILSINDARQEIGRDPVPGGDSHVNAQGVVLTAGTSADDEDGAAGGSGIGGPDGAFGLGLSLKDLTESISRLVEVNDIDGANMLRDVLAGMIGKTLPPIKEIAPASNAPVVNPDTAAENPTIPQPDPKDPKGTEEHRDTGGRFSRSADGLYHKLGRLAFGAYRDAEGRAALIAKVPLAAQDAHDGLDEVFAARMASVYNHEKTLAFANVAAAMEAMAADPSLGKDAVLNLLLNRAEFAARVSQAAGGMIAEAVSSGAKLGLKDLVDVGLAEAKLISPERAIAFAEKLTRGFSSKAVKVVGDELYPALRESFLNGENVQQTTSRVAQIFDGHSTDEAAERIARTELNRAMNGGATETYRENGIEKKEWLASLDSCQFCVSMSGKTVEVNKAFLKGNQEWRGADGGTMRATYGDVNHPPLHPHCTCTVVPVLE